MNQPAALPRVLIINPCSLNDDGPVAVSVTNLFAEWPRDHLAQIFRKERGDGRQACGRQWQLTMKEWRTPLGLHRIAVQLRRRWAQFHGPFAVSPPVPGAGHDAGRGQVGSFQRIRRALKVTISSHVLSPRGFRVTRALRRWIADFKPDVIYSILEDRETTAFVRRVADTCHIPVVPHFMDDWMSAPLSEPPDHSRQGARFRADVLHLMKEAPVRMAIGGDMAREYHARYGLVFLPFMNCVDITSYSSPSHHVGGPFVFGYCGSFHSGRGAMLEEFGMVLDELRAMSIDVELRVTCNVTDDAVGRRLQAINSIRFMGTRPRAELAEMMQHADCLVHVDSFGSLKSGDPYFAHSLSAKIPEYLRAGRPILCYGPADHGTMRYVRETGTGVVVGTHDGVALRQAIEQLVRDREWRLTLGRKAYRTAVEQHDATVVREAFSRAMQSAVRRST